MYLNWVLNENWTRIIYESLVKIHVNAVIIDILLYFKFSPWQ